MAENVSSRIGVITDLLLGAAHADDALEGRELVVVRDLLGKLLGGDLPASVNERIERFDPKRFDLVQAAKDFASDPPIQKRKLLELVAAVRDADEEIDLAEDEYLRALGAALGLQPSEFADLTLEVEVLKDDLASIRSVKPPPPPPKKK